MDERVLIVDDDEALVRTISRKLQTLSPELKLIGCSNTTTALETLSETRPNVAVVDLSIDETVGPESGLKMIEEMARVEPTCRIIVVTGHTDSQYGIAALKAGAASFVTKPPNLDLLQALVSDGIVYSQLKRENVRLKKQSRGNPGRTGLNSESPVMAEAIRQAEFSAEHGLPVLITGETGSGKGVFARAIHRASKRKGNFVRFFPSGRSAELIASELFGHERGAFTGAVATRVGLLEEANNGTLFIDEVDELPNDVQVMLLEALQEKRFKRVGGNREIASNFRIIAAMNRNLEEAVRAGKLREDFLHRIAQQRLSIPPLRERPEDIETLANYFVAEIAEKEKLAAQRITDEGLFKLAAYDWPGNVRELQAVAEMACYRAHLEDHQTIYPDDIVLTTLNNDAGEPSGTLRTQLQSYEQKLVKNALRNAENNQSKAARALGIDRTSLRRILAKNPGH